MAKFKAVCGADFDHCEKGQCSACSLEQRKKCEDEVSRVRNKTKKKKE